MVYPDIMVTSQATDPLPLIPVQIYPTINENKVSKDREVPVWSLWKQVEHVDQFVPG